MSKSFNVGLGPLENFYEILLLKELFQKQSEILLLLSLQSLDCE